MQNLTKAQNTIILVALENFLDDCKNYWEDSFDDVVKEIKEYANCKFKKPIDEREATNFHINNNIIEED